MKRLQKLFAMTAVMAMLASSAYSQEPVAYDDSAAYYDSGAASNMSVWIPVGALVVAGIIIATTNNHHHHHHRNASNPTTFHAHVGGF